MGLVIYSPARAKQLRYLVWAAFVMGAATLGLAVFIAVLGGSLRYATFVAVPAVVLLATAMLTLRALEERGFEARVWCLLTGGVLVVVGLLLASAVVGILPSIVGVLIVLLALLPDVGDQ